MLLFCIACQTFRDTKRKQRKPRRKRVQVECMNGFTQPRKTSQCFLWERGRENSFSSSHNYDTYNFFPIIVFPCSLNMMLWKWKMLAWCLADAVTSFFVRCRFYVTINLSSKFKCIIVMLVIWCVGCCDNSATRDWFMS